MGWVQSEILLFDSAGEDTSSTEHIMNQDLLVKKIKLNYMSHSENCVFFIKLIIKDL